MTKLNFKQKEIEGYLSNGEKGHADLFYRLNKDDYVITSMKGVEGYHWNEKTKLWDELYMSSLISDICEFIVKHVTSFEKAMNKTDDEDEDEDVAEFKKKKFEERKKKFVGIRKSVNSARHNESVVKFLIKDFFRKDFMSLLNSHSYHLPIAGGKILNLKTLEERQRIRTDYFTYEINCKLLPQNKTPHADLFFSQVMCENKEKIKHFQKCLGYTITGEVGQKCFFVMIGPSGDNAKSTIMQLLKGLFGKHYTAIQKDILFSLGDRKKQKDLSAYIAELHGMRIGVYNEPEEGMEMNEAEVKAITGYDEITAKKLYRDPFTFTPIIKIWIMTNKYFKFDDTSEPMRKRCKIFDMKAQFSSNHKQLGVGKYKKDENFVTDLKTTYRDEVFSWIVRGAYLYFKDGHLNPPAISEKEMDSYVEMIDPVSLFINQKCIRDEKAKTNRTLLFSDYIEWCKEKQEKMMTREKFYAKLATLKFVPTICNGVRLFRGLKLKESECEEEEEDIPSCEEGQPSKKKNAGRFVGKADKDLSPLGANFLANDPTDFGIDKSDKSVHIVPEKQKIVHKKEDKCMFTKITKYDEYEVGYSDDDLGDDHGENFKIDFTELQ
jgi:P4 family phage/plasmid primase-like protien